MTVDKINVDKINVNEIDVVEIENLMSTKLKKLYG